MIQTKSVALSFFAILFLALAGGGCGRHRYVNKAERAYWDGRYLEVQEQLDRHESEVASLPLPRRVRYAVFRGLAALQLGDKPNAERWLEYAYGLERTQPTLQPRHRAHLDAGWEQLRQQ